MTEIMHDTLNTLINNDIIIDEPFHNSNPKEYIKSIDDLRQLLRLVNPLGDDFIDYLLDGKYLDGKGIWRSSGRSTLASRWIAR